MTIYKDKQRDERTVREIIAGWMGFRCFSYILMMQTFYQCELRCGHKGKHVDGKVSWGYGDNWLKKFMEDSTHD